MNGLVAWADSLDGLYQCRKLFNTAVWIVFDHCDFNDVVPFFWLQSRRLTVQRDDTTLSNGQRGCAFFVHISLHLSVLSKLRIIQRWDLRDVTTTLAIQAP